MENKGLYINELPQSGEVTFLAVVIEKELRPKRNGGPSWQPALQIEAANWTAKSGITRKPSLNYSTATTWSRRGTIDHYNDKPQLIVSRIRRCDASEYNAGDFYPASSRDPSEMFGGLRAFIAMARDDVHRQLLESIVSDTSISERLRVAPTTVQVDDVRSVVQIRGFIHSVTVSAIRVGGPRSPAMRFDLINLPSRVIDISCPMMDDFGLMKP